MLLLAFALSAASHTKEDSFVRVENGQFIRGKPTVS